MVVRWQGVLRDWVRKVKALNTNWQLQESHRDVKYSTGNVINNVITLRCVRWVLDLLGDHFISYINVQPLCCIPKTNVILDVNNN